MKKWVLISFFIFLCLVTFMGWAIAADQKIDDLRPKVTTCCFQMTENWCIECTKFADSNFEYYKQQYEAGR